MITPATMFKKPDTEKALHHADKTGESAFIFLSLVKTHRKCCRRCTKHLALIRQCVELRPTLQSNWVCARLERIAVRRGRGALMA